MCGIGPGIAPIQPHARMNTPVTHVDCRGCPFLDQIDIAAPGRTISFVFAENRKRGGDFDFGLFINQHAHGAEVRRYPFERRLCALFESPINACYRDLDALRRKFPVIFTHQQRLFRQGPPFVELLFGTNWVNVTSDADVVDVTGFHPEKTRNVSFIGSIAHPDQDAYRFRREVAEAMLRRSDVDCFGKGIREVADKRIALEPYRFSIAMENDASDFYFTEKLIDCILTETVPIYYGCPGIGELLDPGGLLTFASHAQLVALLPRLTPQLYNEVRPFALMNKAKVIDARWSSHRALFSRIADFIEQSITIMEGKPIVRQGVFRRALALLANVTRR